MSNMDRHQLKVLIAQTLKELGYYSEDAVNLLMGTCAQESALGKYVRQIGGGPALGIFQMEPDTFRDIRRNYLVHRPDLWRKVAEVAGVTQLRSDDLVSNLKLAICMARVHYLRVPEPLPDCIEGYAKYWKKWYNTPEGKGKVDEFIANYKSYVL